MLIAREERKPNVHKETLRDIENRANIPYLMLCNRYNRTPNMAHNRLRDWLIRRELRKPGKISSMLGGRQNG